MDINGSINTSAVMRPPTVSVSPRPQSRQQSRPPSQSRRESFPGKLTIPIANQTPTIVDTEPMSSPIQSAPSAHIFPPRMSSQPIIPEAMPIYSLRDESQTGGNASFVGFQNPPQPIHIRSMSTSSYATAYTQRTQSTQAIPARTLSHSLVTKQHRRGRGSISSTTGRARANTPIKFIKRTLLGAPGKDKHVNIDTYEELQSQTTEGSRSGFQYAATPSVGNSNLQSNRGTPQPRSAPRERELTPIERSAQLQLPSLRTKLQASPIPAKIRPLRIRLEGIKFFKDFTQKLRKVFSGKQKTNCFPWTISIRIKRRKPKSAERKMPSFGGEERNKSRFNSLRSVRSRKDKAKEGIQEIEGFRQKEIAEYVWEEEEKTLRIKNNKKGCCIFVVTSSRTNPEETHEFPVPLFHLKSQLFVHSKPLVRALEEWNRHYQQPPPHWVINFVPKAYLRRGWHLAEAVVEYLRTYGLNLDEGEDLDGGIPYRKVSRPWRVEYEAIGYKACLVGEGGKLYRNAGINYTSAGNGTERHPSRVWERKEEWDGCKGLVVGVAM